MHTKVIPLGLALGIALVACGGSVAVGQSSGSGSGTGGKASAGATTGHTASSAATTGVGGGMACGKVNGCPSSTDYCAFPLQNCGTGDDMGTCEPKPLDCSGVPTMAVCACDGKTYDNACLAELAGTDVNGHGGCPAPAGTFSCGTGYCQTDQELCAYSLQAPVPACMPLPASCLPPNADVCSCLANAFCSGCTGSPGQLTATCGGG
jgi:hypothetical protein